MIYDGTNAATKTWLDPDERDSITAAANAAGTAIYFMSDRRSTVRRASIAHNPHVEATQ